MACSVGEKNVKFVKFKIIQMTREKIFSSEEKLKLNIKLPRENQPVESMSSKLAPRKSSRVCGID